MEISYNNTERAWYKSQQSNLIKKITIFFYIIGVCSGLGLGTYIYNTRHEILKKELLDANKYKDYYKNEYPLRPRI